MKYALGNMLNGAGGLNPDGLALDLQFAADKTLTARKGPTPVFTRGSGNNGGTTYFGPSIINVVYSYLGASYNVSLSQDQVVNGRWQWKGGDAEVYFANPNWLLTHDSNLVATSASATNAWRPDLANWSGTDATVTTGNTFGIVKAANDEPRFDHNPANPTVCRGLLIEESRTNLLSRSEEFNETAWLKLRSSISANSTTSPSGDNSADKLIEDSSSGTHMTYRTLNTGSLVAHTFSVYAKADGRNFIYLSCGDGFPANSYAFFNLSNGTLGNVGTNATASITAFGNGWYRCSVTATPTSTTTNGFYIQTASANGTVSYQGDGTSGIFIWGAQLEAGSFATSYIPTTTGTVIRSADVCSITVAAFSGLWNNNEGSLFASGDARTTATGVATYVMANSGANTNQVSIYRNSTTNLYGVANSGLYTANIQFASSNGSFNKIAGSYATNDARSAANGTLGTPDATVTVPTNLTRLNIGSAGMANIEFANGCIAAIRYFRKPLSNAKLQALTV